MGPFFTALLSVVLRGRHRDRCMNAEMVVMAMLVVVMVVVAAVVVGAMMVALALVSVVLQSK